MSDSFYENKRDGVVARALKKYGTPVTLRRITVGAYDEVEGCTGADTVASHQANAIFENYSAKEVDGTQIRRVERTSPDASSAIIRRGDMKVTLGASTEGSVIPEPLTGDSIVTKKGIVWQVVNSEAISPGDVDLMYLVQVRK